MVEFASWYSEGDSAITKRRLILEQHRDLVIRDMNELSCNLQVIEVKIIRFQTEKTN